MTLQFGDQIGYSKIKLRTDLSYTVYGASICFELFTPTVAYCGERYDTQSQLYFLGNGHRVYNSRLMRFHTPDAHSPFLQGGINSYCYCKDDPVNFSDPTGKTRTPLQPVNTSIRRRGFNSTLHRASVFVQREMSARAEARVARVTARRTTQSAHDLFQSAQMNRAEASTANDPIQRQFFSIAAELDQREALRQLEQSLTSSSQSSEFSQQADALAEDSFFLRRFESENFPPPRVHSPALSVQTDQVTTIQPLAASIRRTTVIGVSSRIRRNDQP